MKVTFVTDTYHPQTNGVARTLERLVRGLRERGHAVDVIRPAILGTEEDGMEVPSVPLPGYDGLHVGLSTRFPILARWNKERPDVVYVATETPLGIAAINAANALKVPVVSGFHTNFQQYLSYYKLSGFEPIATFYLKTVHNLSLRTYVPCEDVRLALRAEGFDNLELLPKGVDTHLFDPNRRDEALRTNWGASEVAPVGMFVGRIAAEKNLPLAARAFRLMAERAPDFCGVFVGDGPKRDELAEQYPEFHFVGAKYGEDLARHYASADIFVFPSTTETFGNVILEAMASGLVTVAYDYVAAREHIQNGVNGFTAEFEQEDALLESCLHALDQRHWSDVRQQARQTAVGVSWDCVIDDFESSLRQLVRGHAESSGDLLATS